MGMATGAAVTVPLPCRLPTWHGVLVAQEHGPAAGDDFRLDAVGRIGRIWGPGGHKGTEILRSASPGWRAGQCHAAQPRSGSSAGDGRRPAGSSAWGTALPKSWVRQGQAPNRTPRDGSGPYLDQLQVSKRRHAVVGAVRGAAHAVGAALLPIPAAAAPGGRQGRVHGGRRRRAGTCQRASLFTLQKTAERVRRCPGGEPGTAGCSHLRVAVPVRRRGSRRRLHFRTSVPPSLSPPPHGPAESGQLGAGRRERCL